MNKLLQKELIASRMVKVLLHVRPTSFTDRCLYVLQAALISVRVVRPGRADAIYRMEPSTTVEGALQALDLPPWSKCTPQLASPDPSAVGVKQSWPSFHSGPPTTVEGALQALSGRTANSASLILRRDQVMQTGVYTLAMAAAPPGERQHHPL